MAVSLAWIHAHAQGAPVTVTSPTPAGKQFYVRIGFDAKPSTMGDLLFLGDLAFCPRSVAATGEEGDNSGTSDEEEDDLE